MFRALPAHSQEAPHKRHLVYCVRVTSVGCYHGWSETGVSDNIRIAVCVARPENEQVMLETCKTKLNSVALVRERTIPTERPPPVGEVSANFCG
jgi:hypothetical protein